MTNTFRPRLSREQRDRLTDIAESLNGAEVATIHEALEIVLAYHEVLQNDVSCPHCGESRIDQTGTGTWDCWRCESYPDIFDVLDVEDEDSADIPHIPLP